MLSWLPRVDIDECSMSMEEGICGEDQECVNTPGSFNCTCVSGFVEDENNNCEGLFHCVYQVRNLVNTIAHIIILIKSVFSCDITVPVLCWIINFCARLY